MLTKRIIPCLDVKNGRVVKGEKFKNLKDAGDPVELARKYYEQGADELVFLDITASYENRKTMIDVVRKTAKEIFIPFTVGGGIRTVNDIRNLLNAGADKVSINTAAVKNPKLIKEASRKFGSQCIVVAIDAKRKGNSWEVYINGGRTPTGLDAIEWAKKVEKLGTGEILLTSMDADGTKCGYDLELARKVSGAVNIPVIASGGAGKLDDIERVFTEGNADAALVASMLHYEKYTIKDIKKFLDKKGIVVRKGKVLKNQSKLYKIKNQLNIYLDFPKKGIKFLDISPLISNPKNFRTIVDTLYKKYKNSEITKIIAIESRGFLFGSALSFLLKVPLVMARKKGKIPGDVVGYSYNSEYGKNILELRKDAVNPIDKLLIIDDIFATGGTLNAITSILKKLGCSNYQCCAIINAIDVEKKYDIRNAESLIDLSVSSLKVN